MPRFSADDKILSMFRKGFAPSRIDEVLGKEPGTAHDYIVMWWRYDKEGSSREKHRSKYPRIEIHTPDGYSDDMLIG